MRQIETNTMKRITKAMAKKLYNNHEDILVTTSNMNLYSMWFDPIRMQNDNFTSFESKVNTFEYYNCNNEVGKYTMFFKIIK